MAWTIEFTETAKRQLKSLDRPWQLKILDYLEKDIAHLDDPRTRGKALVGDRKGLWRFRVGDFRVVCDIIEQELLILAVVIGHRKDIYRA
ncbi:MAG: type II toxin-antitoxin system RelE family toxin [Rectinemataceae bacterium]